MVRTVTTRLVINVIATLGMSAEIVLAAITDAYQVHVTAPRIGYLEVHGAPNTVRPSSLVFVENLSSSWIWQRSAISHADGSFVIKLNGAVEDVLSITDETGSGIEFAATLVTIKNPYTSYAHWFVGQGHTHTNNTDGRNAPSLVESAYHDAGYDFVVSSDHRGMSPNFVDPDDGMTPNPDNSQVDKDLMWVSGSELSLLNAHLGAWGQPERIKIARLWEGISSTIEAVREAGGLLVMNHPMNEAGARAWDWHSEIVPNQNISMVEAFNGKPPPEQTGSEHIKDAIDLADAFRQVWWIGTDDTHDVYDPNQFDKYAIVLQSDESNLTEKDMLASADAGRMYIRETADGPAIDTVMSMGNRISIEFANPDEIFSVTWKKRGNATIAEQYGITGQTHIDVDGSEGYVRAEIERLSDGLRAYTQPLFVGNTIDLSKSATSSTANSNQLIDNDRSTIWQAGGPTGQFTIDTGASRPLNAMRIEWSENLGRRFDYRIIASATGNFSGEEFQVVRDTYSNRSIMTIDFFDAYARYLRVEISGQSVGSAGQAEIREIEIYDASPAETQLWVDNAIGEDSNSGTTDAPFRTVNRALKDIRPRDTINVRNTGIPYPGPLVLHAKDGGMHESARVRIVGNPAAPTEIDGNGADFAVKFNGSRFMDFSHFEVYSAATANILAFDTQDLAISGNRLHGSLRRGMQGTGDFSLRYNLIYDNNEDGLLIYGAETSILVSNNALVGNGTHGIRIVADSGSSAEIRNNISSENAISAFNNSSTALVVDSHNCSSGDYLGPWSKISSIELESIEFRDAALADFRLQEGSPCIDAGIDLGETGDYSGNGITDIAGSPNVGSAGEHDRTYVDIGAFEYVDECSLCNGGCH